MPAAPAPIMKLRLVGDIRFVLLKCKKPAEVGRLLSYSKSLRGHFFESLEVEVEEVEELEVAKKNSMTSQNVLGSDFELRLCALSYRPSFRSFGSFARPASSRL